MSTIYIIYYIKIDNTTYELKEIKGTIAGEVKNGDKVSVVENFEAKMGSSVKVTVLDGTIEGYVKAADLRTPVKEVTLIIN